MCLVAIDFILFRVGLLWRLSPGFSWDFEGENRYSLFTAAREFETQQAALGRTELAGSSVVIFGADEALINARLRRAGIPPLLRLATHGSDATDSALLVWNSVATHPWLVLYGAAFRDFPKAPPAETRVTRTFYDSSVELPALPRKGAEAILDAHVKRYWKLYRYRAFTRDVLQTLLGDLTVRFNRPPPAWATDVSAPPSVPPEALTYFRAAWISPESWAAWSRWQRTRQFADYLDWMHLYGSLALESYKTQTLATFGPDGNVQVASLRWMLSVLQQHQTRCVIVYFPENPVFLDSAARGYFDPALSDAYADLFKREAEGHGARFVDLRDFIEPEGFYDMIHLNNVGRHKLSERLATIIGEEWEKRATGGR